MKLRDIHDNLEITPSKQWLQASTKTSKEHQSNTIQQCTTMNVQHNNVTYILQKISSDLQLLPHSAHTKRRQISTDNRAMNTGKINHTNVRPNLIQVSLIKFSYY